MKLEQLIKRENFKQIFTDSISSYLEKPVHGEERLFGESMGTPRV